MAYKKVRLGDYLLGYDEINKDGEFSEVDDLQGINNEKYFQGCQSNKNDIDLSRYRICRHGMFAYNKATSRNGEKISIAYRTDGDCLISPSYICFSIKDENVLMPEYLMLWFKRPVFDRYVRFNSWGSATEFFTWEDFQAIEFYLPPIEEQQKIVRQYKTITDRIEVLEKINEKLIQLCLVLYKSTFDNVDYPMGKLEELITVKYGKDHQSLADGNIPLYGSGGIMRYGEKPLYTEESVLIPRKGSLNNIMYVNEPFWSVDTMFYTQMKKDNVAKYVYFFLKAINMSELNSGSAVPSMTTKTLNDMDIKIPDKTVLAEFDKQLTPMFETINANVKEIGLLRSIDIRL